MTIGPDQIDSKFRFVLVASRRAEQLLRGARPKVDASGKKHTRMAQEEVNSGLVHWDYGPPPAPEPTAAEELAAAAAVDESTGEDADVAVEEAGEEVH